MWTHYRPFNFTKGTNTFALLETWENEGNQTKKKRQQTNLCLSNFERYKFKTTKGVNKHANTFL